MKFKVSQSGSQFSFVLTEDNGSFLAKSSTFNSQDECISAIRAVIPALTNEASFTVSGNSFTLNVGGAAVANSNDYDSNAAATAAMRAIVEDASDEAQYTVEVVTEVESTESKFVELTSFADIDYASLYDFTQISTSKTAGFDPNESDGNYSFFYNGADGNTILFSRKFDTSGRRDKRIRQIIKAAEKEERFEIIEEGGSFYFIIKARNMAEIGRSRTYTSRNLAEADVAYCMRTIPEFTEQYPEPKKKKRKANEYNFTIKSDLAEKGFHSVKDENNDHFFVFNDDYGKAVLYSQGYTSGTSRDNGIKTIIKNAEKTEQHEVQEIDGKFYFVLRAGNRQEIGRSAAFASKQEAELNLATTLESAKSYASKYGVVIETKKITTETNSFVIDVDLPEEKSESNRNEDEYLDCEVYAGHQETPAEGFRTFEKDGEFYFVMQDPSGKVLLRSEGYPTTGARDNGLASVQKNRELPERYSIVEDEGEYFVVLKAGNHKEIARSCPFESEANASAMFGFINDKNKGFPWALPLVAAAALSVSSDREEDNYLACKAYEGHEESPKPGFLTFTHEENGEHYFAMYDAVSGKTLLRSEGYPTKSARDNGLESVEKNRGIKERYSFVESDSGYHFVVLKAGNHKEIARSCGYKDKGALMALFPFLGSDYSGGFPWEIAGIAASATAITPLVLETEKKDVFETPNLKNETVEKESDSAKVAAASMIGSAAAGAVGAAAANVPETKATVAAFDDESIGAAGGGGFGGEGGGIPRWLWALLAALLLGLLLWWLLRSCDGKSKEMPIVADAPQAVVIDSMDVQAPASAVVESTSDSLQITKEEEAAPLVAEEIASDTPIGGTDCGCDTGKEPLFMSYSYKPKTLTKLGSNTEFGNSHALSPNQFYDKLNNAYASNEVDRVFLDRIFKSMGYRNGWTDAKPSMFSNTIVPYGTVGNIGYGKDHRTQYSTLNLGEYDQKAFLIKSKNGCDVRFMKTCGNHMFYCTK